MREASIEAFLARMSREFQGLGSRELNGNKTPAVGPIQNKDLKAAWQIFKEFQGLGAKWKPLNLRISRLRGCWFPGVLGRVLAVIRDQVETPKLKDFEASGLLVSRCPCQGVSGNKGPSRNP